MGMAVSAAYIPSITDNCTPALSCSYMDTIWRITIGIGAIPAALFRPSSLLWVPIFVCFQKLGFIEIKMKQAHSTQFVQGRLLLKG